MALKIVDVSRHQGGPIDWSKVKDSQDGVLIRLGIRGYYYNRIVYDDYALQNIKGADAVGLPWGVYFFSQAITADEGREEALWTIRQLKGLAEDKLLPSLPVYIDSELSGSKGNIGRADHLDKATRTSAVKAFCETMEAAGYYVGIYASLYWFRDNLDDSQLKKYDHWIAYWKNAEAVPYDGQVGIWQYTNYGSCPGIPARVDLNRAYINFPELIKTRGLNGWEKQEPAKKIVPISSDPIQLIIGPASSGDRHAFRRLLEGLDVEFRDDGTYVISGRVSAGDQVTILKRADELKVPVHEFVNKEPADEQADIHGREEGGKVAEGTEKPVEGAEEQGTENNETTLPNGENATEAISGEDLSESEGSFLLRLFKFLLKLFGGKD